MARKRSNVVTDSDYKRRDKAEERKTGKNMGGFVDLSPKKPRGK